MSNIGACHAWRRGLRSVALGVNPTQIPEATEQLRKAGVSESEAHFTREGHLMIHSRQARKRILKTVGMIDKDSFNDG